MKLKGRRVEQLALLKKLGAVSRETAVCCSFDKAFSTGTLSNMVAEGLTAWAQLPYKGDSKRRLSHYWLTPAGLEAAP